SSDVCSSDLDAQRFGEYHSLGVRFLRALDILAADRYASALRPRVPSTPPTASRKSWSRPRPRGGLRRPVKPAESCSTAERTAFTRTAGKDPSWLPRAPLQLRPPKPLRTVPLPVAFLSQRSMSRSRSQTCSVSRPRASTGSLVTQPGRPG